VPRERRDELIIFLCAQVAIREEEFLEWFKILLKVNRFSPTEVERVHVLQALHHSLLTLVSCGTQGALPVLSRGTSIIIFSLQ
jgi:hypothetical protein